MAKVRMIWNSWFRRPRSCGGAISLQQHKHRQGKTSGCLRPACLFKGDMLPMPPVTERRPVAGTPILYCLLSFHGSATERS